MNAAEIIKFLNDNAGALSVLFTAVVTVSTVVYAVLTAILVSETRRMRKVQTEPMIEVVPSDFDFAIHFLRLRIKNIGLGPAKNVRFSTEVVAGGESAKKLLDEFTSSNFFDTGLKYFGPGQEMFSHYTQMNEDFEGKVESVLAVGVEYESLTGKKYKDNITIDLSEMRGRYQLGKPNAYAIATSLEKIERHFSQISTGFHRLKVDVFDREDREEDRKRTERQIEEFKKKRSDS